MANIDVTSQATLSASSVYSGFPTAYAVDGNTSTVWKANASGPAWLMFTFTSAVKIDEADICGAENRIKDFVFQASNDASTWADLYTGQNTNDTAKVIHTIPNVTAYKYYRIYITSTYGGIANYWAAISEVQLWSAASSYASSGCAVYTITGITATVAASSISWAESKPDGTTVVVSMSTDGTNYSAVTNGGALLTAGTVLNNATIYIKVEMATTDTTVTPTLSNLSISLQSVEDTYSIALEMEPLQRFESAAGNITVTYDGSGALQGAGGPVVAFMQSFAPADLIPKPGQNDQEHINIASISAASNLVRIYYTNAYGNEHINIASITAVGTLTNINDL